MTDTPMMEPLSHPDTPHGLVFSLGYRLAPGTGLAFIASSSAREPYRASGMFHEQSVEAIQFLLDTTRRVSADARLSKTRRYMTSGRGHRTPKTREIWEGMLGTPLPASTALEVPGSHLEYSVIDLEAWAAVPSGSLAADIVRVPGRGLLPDAVAVRGDQRLCAAVADAEPSDRVDAELLSSLQRLMETFRSCGAGYDDVLKLTVYYRDPRSWPVIEAMIAGMFGDHCPAVSGIVVSNLERVGGHVQVSGWARCKGTADCAGSDCGTVDLGQRLCALTGTGALPIFSGGEAANMYQQLPPATIEEQTHLGMLNQTKVLESAGATFGDVFRSNWYLTDIRDWEIAQPIIASYFPGGVIPAPIAVEVSRLTAKQGVRIEPDLWAAVPADR
jgi:enamine deaminase RidA (YjgF/YER057c/UK114 family)